MLPPPALIRLNLTFLALNEYQKGDFISSTVAFFQKLIFNILNPFTNRLS